MFTSPLAAVTTPGNCCSVCSPFHTSTYSCSCSEYREMLKLKPLQLDPSKNNYFSPSTVHFPGCGWYLRDEAWSKHFSAEHQAGPERCLRFRACGRGSGKDTQGRKGNRFRWKQPVWSCSPSPLSSDCSVLFIAFGPCKAGTSDLITQQLYLTTVSLSL